MCSLKNYRSHDEMHHHKDNDNTYSLDMDIDKKGNNEKFKKVHLGKLYSRKALSHIDINSTFRRM
jgi:hypothetical protein